MWGPPRGLLLSQPASAHRHSRTRRQLRIQGRDCVTPRINQGAPTRHERGPAGAGPADTADAPVTPEQLAENPPTREGGADAGETADDPGRGGD